MSDILSFPVKDFLAATAAKQPTPGGGAVAALAGALAANIATMALNYTVGKKAYAAHDAELRSAIAEFRNASTLLQELILEDIAAYETLSGFLKMPEPQRLAHADYPAAVVAAIRAPQTAGGIALATLERCQSLLEKTNKFLLSDLAIAATYAHATVHASQFNVCVNLPLLPNQDEARALRQNLGDLALKADKTYDAIRSHILRTL